MLTTRTHCCSDGRSGERGWTLMEMLITMTLIALISAAVMPAIDSGLQLSQRLQTQARLDQLQAAFTIAYKETAMSIDNTPGQVLNTGTVSIAQGNAVPVQWADVIRIAGSSNVPLTDGYNRPWRVFISDRLSRSVDGINLFYHVVAIVSNNGGPYVAAVGQTLDPGTTFDPATGVLTLAGYDVGVTVNGFTIQRDHLLKSMDKMSRIGKMYAGYYHTQYLANINRDVAIDYFSRPGVTPNRWDGTSGAQHTGGVAAPIPNTGLHTVLGLSATDYTDAWGQVIQIDNSSAATRNPDNATASMSVAPYTAIVSTSLPGGGTASISIVGEL